MDPGDHGLRRALRAVIAVGAVATVLAALGWGARPAGSVLAGAVLAAANLWSLGRVVGPMLVASAGNGAGAARYGVLAGLKILALFGGMWLLMARGWVAPLPLLVGYGALPLGIAMASLLAPRS